MAKENQICFLHGHAPGKKFFSARECLFTRRGSGRNPSLLEWAENPFQKSFLTGF
jgi:hypothetical protein